MKEPKLPNKPMITLPEDPSGCWEWQGKVNAVTGYGSKTFGGKTLLAHRWVWQMLLGPIPEGLVINHLCSNRKCVNPAHLQVTDQAGNCRHGEGAKLSVDQVMEIKRAKPSKKWGTGKELAEKHGVSSALIHDIWEGRAWADVSAPIGLQYRGILYAM